MGINNTNAKAQAFIHNCIDSEHCFDLSGLISADVSQKNEPNQILMSSTLPAISFSRPLFYQAEIPRLISLQKGNWLSLTKLIDSIVMSQSQFFLRGVLSSL